MVNAGFCTLTFVKFCHLINSSVIKAATENKGADVILENLANVNLENDLKIVADHGRIGVMIECNLIRRRGLGSSQKFVIYSFRSLYGGGLPLTSFHGCSINLKEFDK